MRESTLEIAQPLDSAGNTMQSDAIEVVPAPMKAGFATIKINQSKRLIKYEPNSTISDCFKSSRVFVKQWPEQNYHLFTSSSPHLARR